MAFFSKPTPSQWQTTPSCLITNVNGPPGAVSGTFLVHPFHTSENTLFQLSKMWGCAEPLVLDSPENTVFLRADWAQAARFSGWTFVPVSATLTHIIRVLRQLKALKINASWKAVVPKQTKHSYVFLPFALGETTITRKLSPTIATDGSISTATAPVGGGQPGYMLGYYHQYVPGANGGYRVALAQPTYYPPYTGFPTLQHACHPYFVIYTAVQHLEQRHRLTDAQLQVYSNLRAIVALWDDLKEFPVDVNYGQPGWAPGKGIQVPSGSIISVKRAAPDDSGEGDSSSKCTRRRIDGKCELDDQEGLA